jgi:hypothetical protein
MFIFDKAADCLVIFVGTDELLTLAKFLVKLNREFGRKKIPRARETECVDVIGYLGAQI